jgi:hypothetical protein
MTTQPSQHFVGFGLMEDWLVAIDPERVINAECLAQSVGQGNVISLIRQYLIVSQVDAEGHALYCRVPFDAYQSMDGVNPLAHEADTHHQRALAAWAALEAWLTAHALTYRRAVIAAPQSLTLLDGVADFLSPAHVDRDQHGNETEIPY